MAINRANQEFRRRCRARKQPRPSGRPVLRVSHLFSGSRQPRRHPRDRRIGDGLRDGGGARHHRLANNRHHPPDRHDGLPPRRDKQLKWCDVDIDGSCPRLSDSKEGRSVRPIGLPVVEFLQSREGDDSGSYVFPGPRGEDTAFGGLPNHWNEIFFGTPLAGVTLHLSLIHISEPTRPY